MKTIPFCYLIGWTKLNKFYYGVRYKQGATPDTLWSTYYTSSKYVAQFIKEHGDPDIIQVRKVFKCGLQARRWETKVLKRLNAVKSLKWLNFNDTENFYRPPGWKHTDKAKRKMSDIKKMQQRTISDEHKKIISEANKGKKITEHTRKKMSEAAKNVTRTKEWKKNNGLAHRKPIQIYSNQQKKSYVWLTTNSFKKETGFTDLELEQMKKKEGLTIKRITKRVRHNFQVGDTLHFTETGSSSNTVLLD